MLSTKYNQASSASIMSTDSRAPFKSKIHKLTRVRSHAEMSASGSTSTSASTHNTGQQQRSTELDQWHKLMSDYERLQLVASAKAHNKLIRSSSESSLGSSSSLSQTSTVVVASGGSSGTTAAAAGANNNQRPSSMIARLSSQTSSGNQNQNSERETMRENYARESEIGQCLSELVESVVAATRATSERAQVTYEQEGQEQSRPQAAFKSFKLHEAVLAKTLSSSSDNASSGDEAAESALAQDKHFRPRHQVIQVSSLGHFALARQEALGREHVIYAAREFVCAHQAEADRLTVSLSDQSRRSITWVDANNNEDRLEVSQISNCLQDDELVVWLLGVDNASHPRSSDEGLDLDDIAMALNEPVAAKSSQRVEALVWCCSGAQEARRIGDFWEGRSHSENIAHQIEIRASEVAANSPAAEQMKSSGLFVLQQPQPPPPVDRAEPLERRTKQQPEVARAKSASTLDLTTSAPGSARQPITRPTEGANLLANYYRSVTNRMMGGMGNSGGGGGGTSGRLKNFTQEMSKLNGRGQTTLAKSARRLSMALNQFSSQPTSGAAQLQRAEAEPASSTVGVVSGPVAPPAVKPRTSVLKSSPAPERALPRSILKKQCSGDERLGAGEEKSRAGRLERMKQRASCHDLARSVAADGAGEEQQPVKLASRAGPTGSVASRLRQRRPALLLSDEAHRLESTTTTESEQVAEPKSTPGLATSSGTSGDGMVRAKVSTTHLRRSASMKVLAAAQADVLDEKVSDHCEQVSAVVPSERELPASRKRSEFDPRSLRKLTNSEAARALREGADYEASYEERKLRRDKARRRRSMANLGELKCELDAEADANTNLNAHHQQVVARDEATKVSTPSKGFSKSFTLLRQSFRQANLSSMLGLSNGSGRGAAPSAKRAESGPDAEGLESGAQPSSRLETDAQIRQKLEAIKMAEANLLAAKQLKQQAQRLREQQKRNEQQLQIHKQQQQLIYQQQQQHYGQHSNRSHTQQLMFDPVHFYQQQQQQQFYQAHQFQMYQQRQQQQQQQQQQLAYLSSSHSAAHFMAAAAAAAAAQPAVTLAPPLGGGANHFGAYAPPPAMVPFIPNHQLQSPVAAINQSRSAANRYLYQQPEQQAAYATGHADMQTRQQQFIPMSVNHHSSFNIVYTAATSGGGNSGSAHYQPHYVAQPYLAAPPPPSTMSAHIPAQMAPARAHLGLGPAQSETRPPAAIRAKHSSLGASVRKTVRSVLSAGNDKSATKTIAPAPVADAPAPLTKQASNLLKSALKSGSSDGSDDASPASSPSSSSSASSPLSSSSASDSSLASSGSTQNTSARASKSATLTKRELERLRKEFIVNSGGKSCAQPPTPGELAAAAAAQTRKNVTFSTKLTSIL